MALTSRATSAVVTGEVAVTNPFPFTVTLTNVSFCGATFTVVSVIGLVTFADPSKVTDQVASPVVEIVRAVCNLVAVVALPVRAPTKEGEDTEVEIVTALGKLRVTAPVAAEAVIWPPVPVIVKTPVLLIVLPFTLIPGPPTLVPGPDNCVNIIPVVPTVIGGVVVKTQLVPIRVPADINVKSPDSI